MVRTPAPADDNSSPSFRPPPLPTPLFFPPLKNGAVSFLPSFPLPDKLLSLSPFHLFPPPIHTRTHSSHILLPPVTRCESSRPKRKIHISRGINTRLLPFQWGTDGVNVMSGRALKKGVQGILDVFDRKEGIFTRECGRSTAAGFAGITKSFLYKAPTSSSPSLISLSHRRRRPKNHNRLCPKRRPPIDEQLRV